MRSVANAYGAVKMLIYDYLTFSKRYSESRRSYLQDSVVERDGVIVINRPLVLEAEDGI